VSASFLLSILVLVYVYFGYPLVCLVISLVSARHVKKGRCEPRVTIVISAYNESKHIGATIENKLCLDYPQDKLEIIAVSDGSDDSTDDIVRSFAKENVRLIRQEPRQGKTSALNLAMQEASGDIVVFSDANSIYANDALRRLVENFADPQVGYVTGKMVYMDSQGSVSGEGCSAYMRYENLLRDLETRMGSVVGVDGGIDAIRRELYSPMTPDQLPDFVLPLKVIEQGYRVVYEPEAILKEEALKTASDEYRMRVRVSLRALWAMWDMKGLFNPLKYGMFSFQLISHKLLRYLAVIFMAMAFVLNVFLFTRTLVYKALLAMQALFYSAAIAGWALGSRRPVPRILYVPYYFCLVNLAAGHALLKFLRGEKQVVWTPRKG
jgi:cellulose synthase/poly-beta-1,6-N-acetylglucosamine synthase-like glycosyltransferase